MRQSVTILIRENVSRPWRMTGMMEMTRTMRTSSQYHLHRLFDEGVVVGLSDALLVERFAKARDPEAFAALVARHGPRVMAVCRGSLGPTGDADDAFQATFLILLNRIGTFPVGHSLGGWLHQVARRVARQAQIAHVRRRWREAAAEARTESATECDPERTEILGLIREEIDRLPEHFRVPIVLCDLQGLTRDEAAELLGCPAGTIGGRLARARRRLRDRLERKGVSPLGTLVPFTEFVARAGAWRTSLEAAIRTTSSLALGDSASSAALSLARRSTRSLAAFPFKTVISLVIGVSFWVGVVAARHAVESPEAPTSTPSAPTSPSSKAVTVPDLDDPKLAGHFVGRVVGPGGQPIAGARLFLVPNNPIPEARGPVRARTGADGRFAFDAPDMTYTEVDGLPARRSGLLIAIADGYAPDWVFTWGQNRRGGPLAFRAEQGDGSYSKFDS